MRAQDIDFSTKVRVLVPHNEWCIGWWWFPGENHRWLDSIGRKVQFGHQQWMVARCNGAAHDYCPAEALVSLLPMMKRLEGVGAKGEGS